MKKFILIVALLMGGSALIPPVAVATQTQVSDAPMCSLDDPCLFDGYAVSENGSQLKILVKRNSKGQIIALIYGDINQARQCISVPNSTKYCVSYNNVKYYFTLS